MVRLQARVVTAFRNGFRPLQPVGRGIEAPVEDFEVTISGASVPSLDFAALLPLPEQPCRLRQGKTDRSRSQTARQWQSSRT